MKKNLFPYLLMQSILKSLEGAVLGALAFSALALMSFLVVQDFPTIKITPDTMLYGLFVLVLFISYIVAAGVCFGLWFYGKTMREGFNTRRFVLNMLGMGLITWLGFFTVIVSLIALAYWRKFFTNHLVLGMFFDISSFLIGSGAGAWAGLRLKQELVRRSTAESDLFSARWEKIDSKIQARIFWQGSGSAVLSALVANIGFAGLLGIYLATISADFRFFTIGSMMSLVAIGTLISGIPAAIGGYALAYSIYQDFRNSSAKKSNSFLTGSALGGLAGFSICIIFGYPGLTNSHTTSVATVTPIIILVTFLAFLAGGWAGTQLFKRIENW